MSGVLESPWCSLLIDWAHNQPDWSPFWESIRLETGLLLLSAQLSQIKIKIKIKIERYGYGNGKGPVVCWDLCSWGSKCLDWAIYLVYIYTPHILLDLCTVILSVRGWFHKFLKILWCIETSTKWLYASLRVLEEIFRKNYVHSTTMA